jgi:hypothetical protein
MISAPTYLLFGVVCFVATTQAFQLPSPAVRNSSALSMSTTAAPGSSTDENTSKSHLYVPSERDERYQGNIARYLLDLDDEGATFDFCGGMMFQLMLSDKLKSHLEGVASQSTDQPIIHPASQLMMMRTPNYSKSAFADNTSIFHGRELRKIPTANGGMGFVLQLSYADPSGVTAEVDEAAGIVAGKGAESAWTGKAVDPQGWSAEEITTYDGWRGDSFRKWRTVPLYESEGFATFSNEFGKDAFGLNHRFYLHLDNQNKMWLSAEDGCEGTPGESRSLLGKLGGMLFGQ